MNEEHDFTPASLKRQIFHLEIFLGALVLLGLLGFTLLLWPLEEVLPRILKAASQANPSWFLSDVISNDRARPE